MHGDLLRCIKSYVLDTVCVVCSSQLVTTTLYSGTGGCVGTVEVTVRGEKTHHRNFKYLRETRKKDKIHVIVTKTIE